MNNYSLQLVPLFGLTSGQLNTNAIYPVGDGTISVPALDSDQVIRDLNVVGLHIPLGVFSHKRGVMEGDHTQNDSVLEFNFYAQILASVPNLTSIDISRLEKDTRIWRFREVLIDVKENEYHFAYLKAL